MGWIPGLVQRPGATASNLGNKKQNCRLHYTVGVDSTAIGDRGYFHFLIPKDATPIQFAPTEAICYDACEWNPTGVGVEFERLSDQEPLTDSQILWGGRIIRWLNETDGIPLTFRDTPDDRMPVDTEYRGFTTHRSLHEVACDEHYDYVTQSDFDRMVGATLVPPPERKKAKMNYVVTVDEPDKPVFWFRDGVGSYVGEAGDELFIIKTLTDAGEPLYTSVSPVSTDFKKQFTIIRDYKPVAPGA